MSISLNFNKDIRDWKNLPNEILDNILQKLDDKDRRQCSLTTKFWRSAAQRIIFKHILLKNDKKMNALTDIFSVYQNYSPGNFVRSLHCGELTDSCDIDLLDKFFPFVKDIYVNETQQLFYEKLYKFMINGRFPNLEKIPYIMLDDSYLELILARRENIKELEFQPKAGESMIKFIQHLAQFPKLEKLQLISIEENGMVYLEKLLSTHVSHVKSLDLMFDPPPQTNVDTSIDINGVHSLLNTTDVKICSQDILASGDKALFYIMKKFPKVKNLNVHIELKEGTQTHDYSTCTVASAIQFLVYLFNIRTRITGPMVVTNESTNEVLQQYSDFILKQSSLSSKKLEFELQVVFSWLKFGQLVYLESSNEDDGYTKTNTIKVVYKELVQTAIRDFLKLSNQIGHTDLKSLFIEQVYWDPITELFLIPIILGIVFNHYVNLKVLKLSNLKSFSRRSMNTGIVTEPEEVISLERIIFNNCTLWEKLFPELSQRCPNLKSLKMENCDITRSTDDNLRFLDIFMPLTCLDELWLSISVTSNYYYILTQNTYVRLKTARKEPRYCQIAFRDSCFPPEPYFKDNCVEPDIRLLEDRKNCLFLDIYCNSVKKLVVEIDVMNQNSETEKRYFYE